MRLASSAFLRRAAAMSAPSSYSRRSYPRPGRGYSASPSRPPDAGPELVSGDSHHSAVRAANESLRRGGGVRGPPPPYRQGPHPHRPQYSYGYGYGYGQTPQPGPPYGFVPYNYGHPQQQQPLPPGPHYGYGPPSPYGYWHPPSQPYGRAPAGLGFRPGARQLTPRLADYRRRWRFAQQLPPHQIGNVVTSS